MSLILALMTLNAASGSSTPGNEAANHLVFSSGQSNSIGDAAITDLYAAPVNLTEAAVTAEFSRVWIWVQGGNSFQKLQMGVNNQGFANCFGWEYGFARRWQEQHPTGSLYIVKGGFDGAKISGWDVKTLSNGSNGPYDYEYYYKWNAGKAWLAAQGIDYVQKAFYWQQGESDYDTPIATYQSKLQALMDSHKADGAVQPTTKIIIGGMNNGMENTIGVAQQNYVAGEAQAVYVDHSYYTMHDGIHYDGKAMYMEGYTNMYNAVYGTSLTHPYSL